MKKEFIELNLKKKDIDKVEDALKSVRNYGFGHAELRDFDVLISCDELVKNFTKYETFLLNSGMSPEEIKKHIEEVNKDD